MNLLLLILGGWRGVVLAAALLAVSGFATLQTWRLHLARLAMLEVREDQARAVMDAFDAKEAAEDRHREEMAAIRQRYEKERSHVETQHAALVADLRSGAVRLRRELRCPPAALVPGAPASAAGSDGYPEIWGEIAAAAVRVGDECDAQLRAAQAVIRGDRE